MTEVLQMGWPFAVVLIASVAGICIIYGLRCTAKAEERRESRTIEGKCREIEKVS